MSQRLPDLQVFLDALRDALVARAEPDSPAAQAVQRIFGALETAGSTFARVPQRLPACRYLEAALGAAATGPAPVARLARAFAGLEPKLRWTARSNALEVGEPFLSGHANAFIVGPEALESRNDVWVGVSLMAPAITYPDHDHPPEEVYVAMSPGSWRQNDDPWREPGPGGIVYNPPDVRHAMCSGAAPLLAVWSNWVER